LIVYPFCNMKPRILGYDVARAFAVFGMVLVNFRITAGSCSDGPQWLIWALDALIGRAAALFVVLAGIGLSLMAGSRDRHQQRADIAAVRHRLFRRSLFLFVCGLLLMNWWSADILHFYGLFLVIGAALLTVSDRWLLVAATTAAALSAMIMGLSEETLYMDYLVPSVPLPLQPAWLINDLLVTGVYPAFPWAGLLLFGIWLGRQDMDNRPLRWRLVRNGLIALVVAGAVSMLGDRMAWELIPDNGDAVAAGWYEMEVFPNTPIFTLSSVASALIVIVCCLHLADRYKDTRWIGILARTGRMAMTLYVGHLVFALTVLNAVAEALKAPAYVAVIACAAGFCAAAMVFSSLWLRHFSCGPLEWAMRRFSASHRLAAVGGGPPDPSCLQNG